MIFCDGHKSGYAIALPKILTKMKLLEGSNTLAYLANTRP
jgi:hypothetical protein